MSLFLDAGALIAFERGSRVVQAFLQRAHRNGEPVRTTTGVIAQVWRKPATQSALARLLTGVEERPFTSESARRTGILLGKARHADVVDAALIDAALDGDEILTSDPDDISRLAEAAGKTLIVTPV
jgi:hypothetical protein